MIPQPQAEVGSELGSHPRHDVPSGSGWARALHAQLGLALVPWMLVGGAVAIDLNHSSGLAAPCAELAAGAEPAARRAWGHLLARASLAGESLELVAGSARWLEEPVAPAATTGGGPAWSEPTRLANFELANGERPPSGETRLEFLVRAADGPWRCEVGTDGDLRVAPAAESDVQAAAGGRVAGGPASQGSLLVDVVAGAMLLWGLGACAALVRDPRARRSGLVALATGALTLALFVTAL